MNKAAFANRAIPGHERERDEGANLARLSTYVFIAIVKKELQLNVSLYTLLQFLSVSVFEKAENSCALQSD
jgi:hypothetical protein